MTGHAITASRSHVRPRRLGRLASLFRGHDDLPEPPVPEVLPAPAEEDPTEFERAAAELARSGSGLAPADEPWWGITNLDNPPQYARPYAPDPLGLFPPAVTAPDPGPLADLGSCLIFRDTVHAVFVRQEEARGFRAPAVPWYERYAGLYRARTGLPVVSFGIADALVQAHKEAKAALTADVRARIDRITDTSYATEVAA